MNRELWMRILQVAVVAPYVYHMSTQSKSDYFRIGLKAVAVGIVLTNAKPLLVQAAPVIKALAEATEKASTYRVLNAKDKESAIDAEYVNS